MDSDQSNQRFVNIVQWNSQSIKPKLTDFECMLFQNKVHIALLSETWLNEEINTNISNYSMYRNDRLDSYGGVAIVTHKSIKSEINHINLSNPGIEVLAIKVLNCKLITNVISLYCPSSVRTTQADWDELFSLFDSKTLIAGDFNAHHTNWSCKNDTRGVQILDSSINYSFIPLNDGSATRVKLVGSILQETSPDITFVSSDIFIDLTWRVLNENLGSDHMLIKVSVVYGDFSHDVKRRNYKKADWSAYRNSIESSLVASNNISNDSVQFDYDTFISIINESANANIPWIKVNTDPTSKFTPKPYWNPALSKLVAQRRLALSSFRRNPTPANLTLLENNSLLVRTELSKARSADWRSMCESIDENTTLSDMWRKMRWVKGYRQPRFNAPEVKKRELLRNLAPDYVKVSKPTFISVNSLLDQPFGMEELESCFKQKDTAPGDDNITYSMMFNLPIIGKIRLLELYNIIFTTSYVPQQWRNVKIIPIPKGQSSSLDVKLRPISLISCICKIYHNMIAKRIEWFVEKNKILSVNTTGFRKRQSCIDSIARLVTTIQIGFTKNIPTLACFLDIQNAYNDVSVEALTKKLDNLRIGSKICSYLWEFLSERHLMIESDNKLVRWTHKGLCQGDPLSPLLFNIVSYDICKSVSIEIGQYADDFVIYTSHKCISTSVSKVQSALNSIDGILSTIGLQISAQKSNFCLFSRGRRQYSIDLSINKTAINASENIRYLGIWMDRSLRWSRHINAVFEKTQRYLNVLKVLAGSNWGVHPKHLRRLYISLIRSRLDFGCFLYDNSAKCHTLKLDKVQNQALRIIGGFIKSTPLHVMESEVSIPPLFIRRKYLGYKYCLKAKSCTNNPTILLLNELGDLCTNRYWQNKQKPLLMTIYNEIKTEKVISSNPLHIYLHDIWLTKINYRYYIKDTLDCVQKAKKDYNYSLLKNEVVSELNSKYNNWYKIYTDGSKGTDALSSGVAFYDAVRKQTECYRNTSPVCIMTLELFAISEALSYAQYNINNNNNIVILSDCKSALQHISGCITGKISSSVAYKIVRQLESFDKNSTCVKLQWIPSHIGLTGNEEVDRLAKSAAIDGSDTYIMPSYSELLPKYKRVCFENWREYFDERSKSKGIWYRTLQSQPHRSPWFVGDVSRKLVVIAHRLRSGHIPLRVFAHMMGKVTSPNCEICDKPEDVYHVLMECVRNQAERRQVFADLRVNEFSVGVVQDILSCPTSREARMIYGLVTPCLQSVNHSVPQSV